MKRNFKINRNGNWISLTDEEETECCDFVLEKLLKESISSYAQDLELTSLSQTEIASLTKVLKHRIYDTIQTILPHSV